MSIIKSTFRINGMHCSSCALNIDFDLEDLPGVKTSKTSYAKQITEIEYDPKQISIEEINAQIQKTGYQSTPQ